MKIIQIHQEAYSSLQKDEVPANNDILNIDNSQSFKYKAALVGKTSDAYNGNSFVKNTKIVVTLKYLCNFGRSLEMPLINCKIHLGLNWIEECILSSDGHSVKFKKTDAKLHVPLVTSSTKDNENLTKTIK